MANELVKTTKNMPDKVLKIGPFTFTEQGMEVEGEPDFETWLACAEQMGKVARLSAKWWALLLAYGEQRWGEKYAQAVDVSGLSYQTLANAVYTVRKIPPEKWNDSLTFEHYRILATYCEDDRDIDEWANKAAEQALSCSELRRLLQETKKNITSWSGEGTIELDGDRIVFYPDCGYVDDIPSGRVKIIIRGRKEDVDA